MFLQHKVQELLLFLVGLLALNDLAFLIFDQVMDLMNIFVRLLYIRLVVILMLSHVGSLHLGVLLYEFLLELSEQFVIDFLETISVLIVIRKRHFFFNYCEAGRFRNT